MRFLLLLIWAVITGLCSYFMQQNCCNGASNAITDTTQASTFDNSFTISGDDGWSITCPAGRFVRSNNELIADNTELQECLSAIGEYQKNHSGQKWVITGDYMSSETNSTIFQNLGEARAQQVKQQLTDNFGIAPTLLGLRGNLVDSTSFRNDTLFNGYSIALGDRPAETEPGDTTTTGTDETPVRENKFDRSKPIELRFDLNSSNPNMDSEIRNRFGNLISDMENDSSISLKLTGHTDSKGEPAYNINLGRERAEAVKQYLIRNGITGNRINTDSKGETMPISDSDAVNRRVEVTIQ